ncbi:MAG: type II toxin-antitoxin system RelE/ParE family toxin [Pseudomonadales bacterium]|nr:type II toxin-antitoxin system RelE/ParE family toxin [Pseudomonadales bacterium]
MMDIRKTDIFVKWLDKLKDRRARARVLARIDRLEMGYFGDVRPVGEGVSELRIFYGPGYRVYFIQHNSVLILLLFGGDKQAQQIDIVKAKKIAKKIEKQLEQ